MKNSFLFCFLSPLDTWSFLLQATSTDYMSYKLTQTSLHTHEKTYANPIPETISSAEVPTRAYVVLSTARIPQESPRPQPHIRLFLDERDAREHACRVLAWNFTLPDMEITNAQVLAYLNAADPDGLRAYARDCFTTVRYDAYILERFLEQRGRRNR